MHNPVTYTIAKQLFTCLICDKTSHAKETSHNKKKEEPTIPIIPTKVVELVVEVTSQPIKPTRMPLRYPCII